MNTVTTNNGQVSINTRSIVNMAYDLKKVGGMNYSCTKENESLYNSLVNLIEGHPFPEMMLKSTGQIVAGFYY